MHISLPTAPRFRVRDNWASRTRNASSHIAIVTLLCGLLTTQQGLAQPAGWGVVGSNSNALRSGAPPATSVETPNAFSVRTTTPPATTATAGRQTRGRVLQQPAAALRQPTSIVSEKKVRLASTGAVGTGVRRANLEESIEAESVPASPAPRASQSTRGSYPDTSGSTGPVIESIGPELILPDTITDGVPEMGPTVPMMEGAPCQAPWCLNACLWADVRADAIWWWTNGGDVPALVTTSPDGTDRAIAGVLGEEGTGVLFGDSAVNNSGAPGVRLVGDFWFDPCRTYGFELGYIRLGEQSDNYSASSTGSPILARPYLDAVTGLEDATLFAYPDVATGSIDISATSELHIADVLFRMREFSEPCRSIDLLAGYRFARLDEGLGIDAFLVSEDEESDVIPGTTLQVLDRFDSENTFNGLLIGFAKQRQFYRGWLDIRTAIAVGNTHSLVTIAGSTTTTVPDDPEPAVAEAGFLALDSNIGRYEQDTFSTIAELGVRYQRQLWCTRWDLSVGYTLIYWSDVARVGDQVDRSLNPTLFPPADLQGPAHPSFEFKTSGYLAHGLSLGLERRF